VAENAKAAEIALTPEDLAELDRDFPAPRKAEPLAMT
jgi:aryl-alcohol dehydrogenase-like predicted oxidoreductase